MLLHSNRNLNQALLFETGLALFLTYVPGMESVFNTVPLRWEHFGFPAIPFSILIFCYDETRKYLMRKARKENPGQKGAFACSVADKLPMCCAHNLTRLLLQAGLSERPTGKVARRTPCCIVTKSVDC